MTRTPNEAVAWCKDQSRSGPAVWQGLCLAFSRTALGIDSMYPSASSAWENARYKHRVSSGIHCPRGTAVLWTGGSQGYGHIVVSVGGGMCYSTDWLRSGRCDLARIDDITRHWGQNFQGWVEDLNGNHYYDKNAASKWASGDVYVRYLHKHATNSDSVRRLQYRLLNHEEVPAKSVRVTGNYTENTASAVQYYQRNVFAGTHGPRDGESMSNAQANHLFGKHYTVHESATRN